VASINPGGDEVIKTLAAASAAFLCVGCASIMNDTSHAMKLDTRRADGTMVNGAECVMSNDYGSNYVKSGTTVQVRRSSKDLDITCKDPANPDAVGRAISRANAGLAGNLIIGGGIGMIIDHTKGTAYTYPTWVQLTFGKTLVFDRMAEREGQPVTGTEPVAAR
jgi:hypothetical protein